MTDTMTNQPLRVARTITAGPYVRVPLAQVPALRSLFDRHGIGYWVQETAVALDGRNYVTLVEFGRNADAERIQTVLDAAG